MADNANVSDHSERTTCIHCGKEIPTGSSFCPYCEKPQQPVTTVKAPPGMRRPLILLLLVAAAAAVIGTLVYHMRQPDVYTGGKSVEYPMNGKTYRIIVSFDGHAAVSGTPSDDLTVKLAPGDGAANPSWLFVSGENDPAAADTFAQQMESFSVTAAPRDGAAAMGCLDPRQTDGEGGTAWVSDITFSPDNGTNDICWDIVMKNGDTIHLEHTVTCEALPSVELHYEDTPLETVDEIRAAIDNVLAEHSSETLLYIYLPPVTYDEPLTLDQHSVTFFGSADGNGQTTFTQTVTVPMRDAVSSEFYDTAFVGNGGTGLSATEGVWLTNCRFEGWDIGADCRDGAWISMAGCDFVNNGIGFRFDSTSSSSMCTTYESMYFTGNETGAQILNVPGGQNIVFVNSLFENNRTDIEDPNGIVQQQ